jgi:hypothetical protein
MQQVRKSVVRWFSHVVAKPQSAKHGKTQLPQLDEAQLQAVKGGTGTSTQSPTKTW